MAQHPTPTIRTAFLVMASHQKLPRPSFKIYVNNISLCKVCSLELKFSLTENFLSSSSAYKLLYGELETSQKSQKIIKMIDLTLNNCSFTWTSLKEILKGFYGNWKPLK